MSDERRLTPRLPREADAGAAELTELIRQVRARTPARVLVGRAGPAYRTETQLELRQDHAAALDAVHKELDPAQDFGPEFVRRWGVYEVTTRARDKTEYLMRPDLGRRLDERSRAEVAWQSPAGQDVQVVIGDGLSAAAVIAQMPRLLPLIEQEVRGRGWSFGRPFVVRYCRVGVLNDIGELLDPAVAVLLVGERPGLATAESLSAYLAYRPRPGHTDAQRNLISNIHARGVAPEEAAKRVMALAEKLRRMQASGVGVKEELVTSAAPPPLVDNQ
jgi:ethanolamine ammonia-lyase small subunit